MAEYRKYLRNQTLKGMTEMETGFSKGLPIPPLQKPYPSGGMLIDLPSHEACRALTSVALSDAIAHRESRRTFSEEAITLEELSFLLWATQGVRGFVRDGLVTLRNVPSGGGMHPFETYIAVHNIEGLKPGLYRYLAVEHQLLLEHEASEGLGSQLIEIANGQPWAGNGAATFVWSTRPPRTEYRYGDDSLKDILISAGHICQNLYLACEGLGLGTCAIVAYQQEPLDKLLGVDGDEEIALYLAPVGRPKPEA